MAKAKSNAVDAMQPGKYKRKSALVLPTYSLKKVATGDRLNLQMLCEIYSKPAVDEKTGEVRMNDKGQPEQIHLIQVRDVDTDAVGEMVMPIIIFNAMEAAGELTGRVFEFVKGVAEANKATKWEVYELDV